MGQSHETPSAAVSAEKSETQSRATDESGKRPRVERLLLKRQWRSKNLLK